MNVMTRYIQERFKLWIYFPLSILLAIGSEFSGLYYLNKVEIIKRILTALLLLLWFRLWDDLCSIVRDSKTAPERITVNQLYTRRLWIWLFILASMSFLIIIQFYNLLIITTLFILTAIFLGLYFFYKKLNEMVFDLLILVKYPAIAFIVSSATSPFKDQILPLLTIYLVMLVYEVFHDRGHVIDRNYLRIGFIAWIALIFGFAVQVIIFRVTNDFSSMKLIILFLCLCLFFIALKFKNVRNFKFISFANGIFYLGMLAIPT